MSLGRLGSDRNVTRTPTPPAVAPVMVIDTKSLILPVPSLPIPSNRTARATSVPICPAKKPTGATKPTTACSVALVVARKHKAGGVCGQFGMSNVIASGDWFSTRSENAITAASHLPEESASSTIGRSNNRTETADFITLVNPISKRRAPWRLYGPAWQSFNMSPCFEAASNAATITCRCPAPVSAGMDALSPEKQMAITWNAASRDDARSVGRGNHLRER
jgi:hypothetical protein